MARTFDATKLKTDCASCDALCCAAFQLPYPDYPKPAHVACKHLDRAACRCTIFPELYDKGWSICRKFECYGAGPAVAKLFREIGRSWHNDPDPKVAKAEFAVFAYVYRAVLQHLNPGGTLADFDLPDEPPADIEPFIEAALDLLSADSVETG